MAEREKKDSPDWAEKERLQDLDWIRQNVHVFWPAAQTMYPSFGRGAFVVDVTKGYPSELQAFGYLDQAGVDQSGEEDIKRLVREYEPREEFVTTLFKSDDRISSYRLRVLAAEGGRGELVDRLEADQSTKANSETSLAPPSIETLMAWADEGVCEAACPYNCVVEPDGTCQHGNHSWLIELGLI
ncbi:MAG: hypothetical protein KDI79_24940 [Anaerolineae bacterium]|nr:hypothetical protein [Anaerolineae bacterium]